MPGLHLSDTKFEPKEPTVTNAILEHINVTVSDPQRTVDMLCALFDWQVRWTGAAKDDGVCFHVGSKDSYLAIYSKGGTEQTGDSYITPGGLNHIGIVVDDLDATEARVRAAGFNPHSHADYEPGRRFYFNDADGIEFEVVSYA